MVGWHKVEIHLMRGDDPGTAVNTIPSRYNASSDLRRQVKPNI
jgi:hypothetical protein